MTYYYKNVDISYLLSSGTTDLTVYYGANFPKLNPVKYNSGIDKPSNIEYKLNGVDLSNSYSAYKVTYNATVNTTLTIPGQSTKWTQISAFAYGGGGGGGGGGGSGRRIVPAPARWFAGATGGPGGQGGYAAVVQASTPETFDNIAITIGNGGLGGGGGSRHSPSSESGSGDNGSPGNAGNETYITINKTGGTQEIIITNGGNGGRGGSSGNANNGNGGAITASGNSGTGRGVLGNSLMNSNSVGQNISVPPGWPSSTESGTNWGMGGSGGSGGTNNGGSANPGSPGYNGYVEIWFLYDPI